MMFDFFRKKQRPFSISLAPDVLKQRIVEYKFERNKDSKISKVEERIIFQKVLKKVKQEASQDFAKKSGILPKDIHWISFETLETKINGYPVAKLRGLEGKDLEIKVLTLFAPKDYAKEIF